MNSPSDSEDDGQGSSSNPRTYIRPAIRAKLNHLDLTGRASIINSRVVASGSFGDVSKSQCTFNDGRVKQVAVKRLRFYLKEDIRLIFEKEIYVWSKLHHPNVLSLLGFVFEESSGYPLLISEWMPNGSSMNYVRNNSDCDLIRLVAGIAEGLAYLHDNGITHSDINPENVVVTDAGDARICDFTGSRIAIASKSIAKPSTGIRGTLRYLARELVALSDEYPRHTKESDVWAFGMTVFALIAQEPPYPLLAEVQVAKAIADRELPSFNFWTTRSSEEKYFLRSICDLCWVHEPRHRAAISSIVASFRDFQSHRNASRPLDSDDLEQSTEDVQLNNENGCLYRPLVMLSSKLVALHGRTDTASEIYQYLHSAMKVSLSLHEVFNEEFQIDKKLDHLMRAMADVMALITAKSIVLTLHNGLLQRAIEGCLFVNKYSRKNYRERNFGTSDGRKMSEFISFFVTFKDAIDLNTGILPALVSSRTLRSMDESALRQRLNPNDSDVKEHQVCFLGTRVAIQERIIEWTLSNSSQNILWLHGDSGSGKSTISASVAEHFQGINRLGAFLSLQRGESDPSSGIRTIAFKLAQFDSTIGSLILSETDRNKNIINASFEIQFEKLFLEPLAASASAQHGPVVIIIDALDACVTPDTYETFIQVFLSGLLRAPSTFRFLVTSRQEWYIKKAFSLQSESVTLLKLDHTSDDSLRDVQYYLNHEMHRIFKDNIGDLDEELMRSIENTVAGHLDWASKVVKLVSKDTDPLQKFEEMASANLFEALNLLQVIRDDVLDALRHFDLSKTLSLKRKFTIGAGAFSEVFKVYSSEKKGYVAAKQLRFYTDALNMIYLFENEIYAWSKLSHVNILPLLGFVINAENGYPLLITDWMKYGSAINYVRTNNNCDLMRLVAGVAEGLAYLHEMGVTHSDLKPENIVISNSGDALICDFGAARIIAATKNLRNLGAGGTVHYMAYELHAEGGESIAYSPSTDVWAFGMTVFALLIRENPYHRCRIDAQVMMAIREKKLPALPETSSWSSARLKAKDMLWDILQLCWKFTPSERPSMVTIRDTINNRMDEESVPVQLFPTDSDFMDVDIS